MAIVSCQYKLNFFYSLAGFKTWTIAFVLIYLIYGYFYVALKLREENENKVMSVSYLEGHSMKQNL